jgi:hypothetical protein
MKTVLASPARLYLASMAIFLLGATLSPAAHAQWKWRDGRGQVTVSDTPPPPGVTDKDILQRPSAAVHRAVPAASAPQAAASVASAPLSPLETEVEARKRKAEQEQKAKEKAVEEAQAAARTENCGRAKSQLRALDEGLRMARVNEKGEREILDDKGRAAESQRARAIIASDCK